MDEALTQPEILKSLRKPENYGFESNENEKVSDYLRESLIQPEAIPLIVDYILNRINNGKGSLIIITGTVGTGKTTFARQLSAALEKAFKGNGSIELSVLDAEEDDKQFTEISKSVIAGQIDQLGLRRKGRIVIISGLRGQISPFLENQTIKQEAFYINLIADEQTRHNNIFNRKGRPNSAKEIGVIRNQVQNFPNYILKGGDNSITVDMSLNSRLSPEGFAQRVHDYLNNLQREKQTS